MKKSILMKSIISIFLFAGMMVISPIHINAAEGDILIDYPDEFIHVETNKKVYFGKFKDEAAANKAFEAGKELTLLFQMIHLAKTMMMLDMPVLIFPI